MWMWRRRGRSPAYILLFLYRLQIHLLSFYISELVGEGKLAFREFIFSCCILILAAGVNFCGIFKPNLIVGYNVSKLLF